MGLQLPMKLLYLEFTFQSPDSVDDSTSQFLTAYNIRCQALRKGSSVALSTRSGSMRRAMDGPLPKPMVFSIYLVYVKHVQQALRTNFDVMETWMPAVSLKD
jgi:hypothetical protein